MTTGSDYGDRQVVEPGTKAEQATAKAAKEKSLAMKDDVEEEIIIEDGPSAQMVVDDNPSRQPSNFLQDDDYFPS